MGSHSRYLTGAPGKQTRPKIIELRQLTVIQEHLPVLHEITLDIFEGESVALLSSSDNAKNVLLACMLGQIQPAQGEMRVLGATLPPLPLEIRRQIGVMPQSVDRNTRATVADYLQRFSMYHGVQLTARQTSFYCAHYQLTPATPVAELSHLQARILTLALALVHDPRLALLGDPLAGLTQKDQVVLHNYLQRIQREGRTLLCTFSPPLAEKQLTGYDLVVKLEQGQVWRQDL